MPVDTSNKPKISEGRKSSKPLMEKRRRARINDSLGQLKSLILEATNKDTSRHSKLEKADILEMTVKYLRNMQRHQLTGSGNPDPAMLNRYRLGYNECISEVSRYLDTSESGVQLHATLINHLANCCSVPQTTNIQQQQTVAYTPTPTPSPIVATAAMGPPPPTSQGIQVQIAPSSMSSVTTVPTTLPSGNVTRIVSGIPIGVPGGISREITVVLPPQVLQGGQLPSHFIPVYAQSAPSLLSPTSSTSSQCFPSPTSVETPTTPTHQTHYVSYQQVHQQELSSPVSYEQNQAEPQTVAMSYMQGVPVNSIPQAIAQAPTLVAIPANVLTPPAEPTTATLQQQQSHLHQQQQQYVAVSQPRIHRQSPPKTLLRTVNINVQQQQCATADENVWRPW